MHIDHEHTLDHDHDHNHDHGCAEASAASPKDLALLTYMLEHNKQHARELSDIGGRFAEAGFARASEMISGAARYFDHANDALGIAVDLIRGE